MIVRNLSPGEQLPAKMVTGFEGATLTPEFVWVCENDGEIVASLITSGAHQIIFLHRLVAAKDAPASALLQLFRGAAVDFFSRGFIAWIVPGPWDLSREAERKLARISKRIGGIGIGGVHGGAIRLFFERGRMAA